MSIKSILAALFSITLIISSPFILFAGPEGLLQIFGIDSTFIKPANVKVGYHWNAVISLALLFWGAWLAAGVSAEEPALKRPIITLSGLGWICVGVLFFAATSHPRLF